MIYLIVWAVIFLLYRFFIWLWADENLQRWQKILLSFYYILGFPGLAFAYFMAFLFRYGGSPPLKMDKCLFASYMLATTIFAGGWGALVWAVNTHTR